MMTEEKIKSTPLLEEHKKKKGFLVNFSGWRLPLYFEGHRQEHEQVRNNAGLFDVSHMGEIRVQGKGALELLEWVTTNDVARLKKGQAQYTLFLNEDGGIVDDLIVYCFEEKENYLLCVNAVNIEKDVLWLQKHNTTGALVHNESTSWAQLALQGPKSFDLLSKVIPFSPMPPFRFQILEDMVVSTTGYTGEKGVELFVPSSKASLLWQKLMDLNVPPIGLAARDSLRIEMNYSLYGHEILENINPKEAGLSWVTKPEKKDFLGKRSLEKSNDSKSLVGFILETSAISRKGYELISFDKEPLGYVTSGTYSPSLKASIGLGYVKKEYKEIGTALQVMIRNRPHKAKVVKTPFIKPG